MAAKTFTEFKDGFRSEYGRLPTLEETWKAAKRSESRKTVRSAVQQAKVKTCPHCESRKVDMFDADNDICRKCGKWFPGS